MQEAERLMKQIRSLNPNTPFEEVLDHIRYADSILELRAVHDALIGCSYYLSLTREHIQLIQEEGARTQRALLEGYRLVPADDFFLP